MAKTTAKPKAESKAEPKTTIEIGDHISFNERQIVEYEYPKPDVAKVLVKPHWVFVVQKSLNPPIQPDSKAIAHEFAKSLFGDGKIKKVK
jgi:hypothetical protein